MRIAIDAKWLFNGPVSSRVVLQNFLPRLLEQYQQHEWILFLDNRDKGKPLPFAGPHIHPVYVWADNNQLSNLFVLPTHFRKWKPDVLLFQTFPAAWSSIPCIVFIHDVLFRDHPEYFGWKEKLYFKPMRWLARHRAARVIATTEYVANDLTRFGYVSEREQIDLAPLGVSESYQPAARQDQAWLSAVKARFNLPDRFLLFVGRLNVRKNITALLQALPAMKDKEIPLVLVGSPDWLTPDLDKLLTDENIRPRTIFTGGISDEELKAVYALATVFCFPSFAEGFGLPPLEAMASGVAVVVSQTTAMPEVCGKAPVYVDPFRPESITDALDQLLSDQELYARCCQAGLERAAQFSWSKTADALMHSIERAAGQ